MGSVDRVGRILLGAIGSGRYNGGRSASISSELGKLDLRRGTHFKSDHIDRLPLFLVLVDYWYPQRS